MLCGDYSSELLKEFQLNNVLVEISEKVKHSQSANLTKKEILRALLIEQK